MLSQSAEIEYSSLGEYLRETRITLGLDLLTVAERTKISLKNLQAIEDNDFAVLPAEAIARGFCALYAKILSLDPQIVLQIYTEESPNHSNSDNSPTFQPNKLAQKVGNMAERPTFAPFSFFGLMLLSLLFLGGIVCWYLSWNPAIYLSQKLRSLGDPQIIEQEVSANRTDPGFFGPNFRSALKKKSRPRYLDLFNLSYPSTATAAIAQEIPRPSTPLSSQVSKYHITANFSEGTKINLAIDDLPEQTLLFKAGDSTSWRASEKAVITLPVKARTKLSLNNTPVNLPDTGKEFITLCLPEQLPQ